MEALDESFEPIQIKTNQTKTKNIDKTMVLAHFLAFSDMWSIKNLVLKLGNTLMASE